MKAEIRIRSVGYGLEVYVIENDNDLLEMEAQITAIIIGLADPVELK